MATIFSFDDDDGIRGRKSSESTRIRSSSVSSIVEDIDSLSLSPTNSRSNVPYTGQETGVGLEKVKEEEEEVDGGNRKDATNLGSSYKVQISGAYMSEEARADKRLPRKCKVSDFEPLRVLGKGAYGKVLLVRDTNTGRLFAQKQLKKASMIVHNSRQLEQTRAERNILESVRHPYIVKLFYALQDQHRLYLILEYAQGGELFTHLAAQKMFSENIASFYAAEIVLALVHLQKNVGVIYRDLKPENCLLDRQGHLLLTDFGLSKVASDEDDDSSSQASTIIGTPEYMAPEILQGKSYDGAVDWWSLGAMIFDLLTGAPPFTGNNHKRIIDKILKTKKINFPYYLSPDAKDLLNKLLKRDPAKRLGANLDKDEKILRSHRFFRKIDWDALETRDESVIPPIIPVVTDPSLAENFDPLFTSMSLQQSPPSVSQIPIKCPNNTNTTSNINSIESTMFQNFSYTASESFIERSAWHMR